MPGKSTRTILCKPGPFTVSDIVYNIFQNEIYTYEQPLKTNDNNDRQKKTPALLIILFNRF